MSKSKVYDKPKYYEIAFGFIDPEEQVDLFEKFISKYSKIEVNRILDIGCGPSLQIREFSKRGYDCVGLDKNQEMLDYLKEIVEEELETINSDMTDFNLDKNVDFAFTLMGTINLIGSNEKFLSHLDSVANSLRSGGIYLIENFGGLDWLSENLFSEDSWIEEKGDINIETTYKVELKSEIKQKVKETIKMKVKDGKKEKKFEETINRKLIFPEEFVSLVKLNVKFEFLGWFERDSTNKLNKADRDNIALLKKK